MTIAFDAASSSSQGTGNLSWTHTPVGTPKGVLVYIVQADTITDEVTSVTYGGVAMTEVAGSPSNLDQSEDGSVYGYFLGGSIPTGAQTVEVTVSGADNKIGTALTATAVADTEVQNTAADAGTANDPSVALALGGQECFVALGIWSGVSSVDPVNPNVGWTERMEALIGGEVGAVHTFDTIGTSDVTAGFDAGGSDQYAILAVAIKEASVGGGDIAAVGTMSFSGTADLDATGSLAAAGAMAFGSSADLDATGDLSAAGALAFASAADLDATGALSAAGAMAFASAADLDATGSLAAAGVLAFSSAANLTGDSDQDMSAVGALAFTGTADLDATGDIAAAGAMAFAGVADLDAVGALAAVGALSIAGVADLDATGSLVAAGALSFAGVADLDALGALAGVGALTWGSSAALTDANAAVQPDVRAITLHRGAAIVLGTQRPEIAGHGSIRIDHG